MGVYYVYMLHVFAMCDVRAHMRACLSVRDQIARACKCVRMYEFMHVCERVCFLHYSITSTYYIYFFLRN